MMHFALVSSAYHASPPLLRRVGLRDGVGLLDLGLEERVALAELRDLLLDALELGLALLEVEGTPRPAGR